MLEVGIEGSENRSFQKWAVRQLRLICQADLKRIAFVGALEQTLPFFVGEKGVCTPLGHLLAERDSAEHRWAPLLRSGHRTGHEMQQSWQIIQREAQDSAVFLGEDVGEEFKTNAEEIGLGRTDSSTCKIISEEIDIEGESYEQSP